MKTILLFLVTMTALAQAKDRERYIAFSVAIDIRNATTGSDATKNVPAADLLYQFAMVGRNVEVNIGYENFTKIGFEKYTIGAGYHFPLYGRIGNRTIKTILIPSLEPTLITRWGNEWQTTSSHLSLGGNVALRWHLSDTIAVELLANALPRTDLAARYPEGNAQVPIRLSGYFKLIYKVN